MARKTCSFSICQKMCRVYTKFRLILYMAGKLISICTICLVPHAEKAENNSNLQLFVYQSVKNLHMSNRRRPYLDFIRFQAELFLYKKGRRPAVSETAGRPPLFRYPFSDKLRFPESLLQSDSYSMIPTNWYYNNLTHLLCLRWLWNHGNLPAFCWSGIRKYSYDPGPHTQLCR